MCQVAHGSVIPKPAKTVINEVTKKLEDGGLKSGVGAVDDLKTKIGKPGANPADDVDSITGKKKIPCYSSLDGSDGNLLDHTVAFLFGGIRAEAGCEGAEKVIINGDEYLFDGDFYYKGDKIYISKKAGTVLVKGDLTDVSDVFKRFQSHYNDHVIIQKEFGNITQAQYLNKAIDAKNQAVDGINIQQKIRSDGSINKYNVKTNELVGYTSDGKILTLFKPENGIDYWNSITN